ncbi:MAG: aminotransferase class I/II-fold pyridoxal phosphate-dependent enzyme [Synergistaceae bacterium]|nr:aminotransferase class I/II-fold pyridoxal phosphate-dependent enzyme [Synergistaceae bacterium]MBQ3449406.1 aminotransferase class I/II-fold pyridoxal phosphate-dependent enzyme [Synergistaceae bacterium]MBQ6111714.1 aminotransferase class I/II-fold pyridoxal phosphate-dependent enzyme [Synergistaceae bacterium]
MKKLSYGRQWINDDDIAEVVRILRGDWLTMGPTVEAFEKRLAEYVGMKHAITYSSGTSALHGAMNAAGLHDGDYAITTAMTFAATSNSVIYTGATPIFVDIDPCTLCLDVTKAESLAREYAGKIKAIVPVSFAGYPLDMKAYRKIANENNAVLIEDASHALGHDRKEFADMMTLSFHPVKHITTGEGGAVLTNDDTYAEKLKHFRNHGMYEKQMHELGYNYRLSEIHCALGLSQLKRVDAFIARRRELAALYLSQLSGVENIKLPPSDKNHVWHIFALQVESNLRDELAEYLREHDINPTTHYKPVPLMPYYRERFGFKSGDFSEAEKYYEQEISLPLYPLMEDSDVKRVTECIKEFMINL